MAYGLGTEDIGLKNQLNCTGGLVVKRIIVMPFSPRHCLYCENLFFPRWRTQKYCCINHQRAAAKNGTAQSRRQLKLRFEIFKRDKFTCQYCGRGPVDGAVLQIDHIFPESKGGEFVYENLTTACQECNIGKRDILLTVLSV